MLAAGTAAAVAAACSGGHKKAAPTTVPTTAAPTTTSTTVPATTTTLSTAFPLTGLPATSAAQQNAPAVIIKVDNVDQARPQTGLNNADIVYEVEVEGGLSRLAAVFQSTYPTNIGPVRSGRLTDEGLADDLNHPVLVFSGTNGIFLPILRQQPVTEVDDDNHPEMFVRVGNNAPHNLYSNVVRLAGLSTSHAPPAPLFKFLPNGTAFSGPGATPAAGIAFNFPAAAVGWTYNAGAGVYERSQNGTPDKLSDGSQINAKTVLLYFINYGTSGVATGEGVAPAPIPDGIQVGSGVAWFLSDGTIVKGKWSRPNLTTPATFTDSNGANIHIPPGRTWVEMVPNGVFPAVTP